MPAIDRANSYLAVMVDDLILQGVTEPYRMLTARAEYRLRLRADNATTRLTSLGIETGVINIERRAAFEKRAAAKADLEAVLSSAASADDLIKTGVDVKRDAGRMPLIQWLRYPTVNIEQLIGASRGTKSPPGETEWPANLLREVEQDGRYAPYIERQASEIRDITANERIGLPASLNYRAVAGLSNEMVERLDAARPETLAAAARVRGITPAALAAILVQAKRANMVTTIAA